MGGKFCQNQSSPPSSTFRNLRVEYINSPSKKSISPISSTMKIIFLSQDIFQKLKKVSRTHSEVIYNKFPSALIFKLFWMLKQIMTSDFIADGLD